jgi:hypothetical protein
MASHVHCRVVSPRGTQPQDELFPYIADEHPNIQSALSQSQPFQRLSTTGIVRPEPTCASFTTGIVRPESNCKTHCRRRCLLLRQSQIPQRRWSHVTAFPASSRQRPVCPWSCSRNLLSSSSRLTHGTYTPPKPVFNVIPLGRHTCRFEARRNV